MSHTCAGCWRIHLFKPPLLFSLASSSLLCCHARQRLGRDSLLRSCSGAAPASVPSSRVLREGHKITHHGDCSAVEVSACFACTLQSASPLRFLLQSEPPSNGVAGRRLPQPENDTQMSRVLWFNSRAQTSTKQAQQAFICDLRATRAGHTLTSSLRTSLGGSHRSTRRTRQRHHCRDAVASSLRTCQLRVKPASFFHRIRRWRQRCLPWSNKSSSATHSTSDVDYLSQRWCLCPRCEGTSLISRRTLTACSPCHGGSRERGPSSGGRRGIPRKFQTWRWVRRRLV
jgi:hypothetical protein